MKGGIRSGSDVVVISGDDKGKSGKVLKVLHKGPPSYRYS